MACSLMHSVVVQHTPDRNVKTWWKNKSPTDEKKTSDHLTLEQIGKHTNSKYTISKSIKRNSQNK